MPLGLLALGSWLEGRHVVIVDGRFELAPEARVVELARHALLLGVSVRTGEPLREAVRVSRAARAASPGLPVLWGGPHVALDPDSCFESGVVDACLPGAGEEPLQAAVDALRGARPLEAATGVQVPGGAALVPATPPKRLWPRADYALLDVERYFEERGVRRLDYCSSRGWRGAPDWMGLRPERVVGEVVELAERYRIAELSFNEEDFFADAARVEEIANGLIDAGAPLEWRAEARAEDVVAVPPESLRRLAASGCRELQLAVAGVAREQVIEAGVGLRDAGLGGRFVYEVAESGDSGRELSAAVKAARTLCALDSRFLTPIRRRQAPPLEARAGRSLEAWASVASQPWSDEPAQRQLARVAFFFTEAQRAPGRRLGQHLLRVLSLLRVRLGFFALDLERAVVESVAVLRTGRPRPASGD